MRQHYVFNWKAPADALILMPTPYLQYNHMKKFALILAMAAMGCASAAITLPTSKAELKSGYEAQKSAAKKLVSDKVATQTATDTAKKEAAQKAVTAAITEKTSAVTDKVTEAKSQLDSARKAVEDAKAAVESVKEKALFIKD